MTYVSHTVRSIRRDPVPGETVRLVLTLGGDDAGGSGNESDVRDAIATLGGEVVRELEFDRLLVAVEQTEVDGVCSLDGVTAVETDAVLEFPS